jgi:hypothetical protein
MNKLLVALIGRRLRQRCRSRKPPLRLRRTREADSERTASRRQIDDRRRCCINHGCPDRQGSRRKHKASKETAKMTTAEKEQGHQGRQQADDQPGNPSGSGAGTAAQQKANVAESKGQPKANDELKTKEGQKSSRRN